MIDWGNPNWGIEGHNVHIADNGSHVPDHNGDREE